MIAWQVTYRRDRFQPNYKTEQVVIVAEDGRLQELLDTLRETHPDALVDTVQHLGDALVAPALNQEAQSAATGSNRKEMS